MTDKKTSQCEFLTRVAPVLAGTRKPDVSRKIGGFQQIFAPGDTRSLQGIGMPPNAAVAAIQFALETDEGLVFLR